MSAVTNRFAQPCVCGYAEAGKPSPKRDTYEQAEGAGQADASFEFWFCFWDAGGGDYGGVGFAKAQSALGQMGGGIGEACGLVEGFQGVVEGEAPHIAFGGGVQPLRVYFGGGLLFGIGF